MLRELHKRLIKLIVGKMPVILNVHFITGFVVGKEHLVEREVMVASCSVHSRAEDCNLRYFCFTNESGVSDVQT